MAEAASQPITGIGVCGFKSIATAQYIQIRPLTILAGANSSGKSSIMQPLLLLKQTLEAPYDPGPLLLDGPNVRFTSREQLFSTCDPEAAGSFSVSIEANALDKTTLSFVRAEPAGLDIGSIAIAYPKGTLTIARQMSHEEIDARIERFYGPLGSGWAVVRNRCFLALKQQYSSMSIEAPGALAASLQRVVHVPGLRGNPARAYPSTPVDDRFPGTFEHYVGSVVAQWQASAGSDRLELLEGALRELGLTSRLRAERLDDTRVAVLVSRAPGTVGPSAGSMVSIADVGFGVSQALPAVAALFAARAGDLVYIEQPELHLHPRAQFQMAAVLAQAARLGVRVIAETHSAALLRGIQTLVARGDVSSDLVKLHWFERDAAGATHVHSAGLDNAGAFGDWPEDFDEVALQVESDYLDAVEARRTRR